MPTPKRLTPWLTFSIAWGNTIQIGGLLGRSCSPGTPVGKGFEARAR